MSWLQSDDCVIRVSSTSARVGYAIAILGLTLSACGEGVGESGDASTLEMDAARPDGGDRDGATALDAGPPGCTSDAECDDRVDCTADTCTLSTGACRHQILPALCPAGSSCHPVRGCEMGRPCATDEDCADEDACTTGERCDAAARVCVVDPLDGDGDGDPPRVCGGADCDDSDAAVYAGADERCNTIDDDCDARIDEGLEETVCSFCRTVNACGAEDMHACYVRVEAQLGALACTNRAAVASAVGACASSSCAGYASCRDAAGAMCACPAGRMFCGGFFGACADTSTDNAHCGSCGFWCPSDMSCSSGRCRCLDERLTNCGLRCVDITTSRAHCGSCGNACPSDASCVAGSCACFGDLSFCAGACVDTATDGGHCGSCGNACPAGASCSGGLCACPSWAPTVCGSTCVDLDSDAAHCGACGRACATGQACIDGACTACGRVGQPCCPDPSGRAYCIEGWCDTRTTWECVAS